MQEVPAAEAVLAGRRRDRQQQVQGRRQSGPQLHVRQDRATQAAVEQSVPRYLDALETADRTHPEGFQSKVKRLQQKIATLRDQMHRLDRTKEQLSCEPDGQPSRTDPDSRSMVSQAMGTGTVGYSVQAAVEAKNHLIVHHEVTNVGSDRAQLAKVARTARDVMGKNKLRAYADRGYYSAPEIKDCADAAIAAYVPKPMTSGAKAERGRQERFHQHRQGLRVPVPGR